MRRFYEIHPSSQLLLKVHFSEGLKYSFFDV